MGPEKRFGARRASLRPAENDTGKATSRKRHLASYAAVTTPILALLLLTNLAARADIVTYELVFDVSWSSETHPDAFPNAAHFSPLVGLTHNSDYTLWSPGELASPGTQRIAETGGTTTAQAEMTAAISAGSGDATFSFGGLSRLPRSLQGEFAAQLSHSYVTFASMVAPSPDWFVGGSSVSLRQDGRWIPEITIDMIPWDAGTDSGLTFTAANLATSPHVPIHPILVPPFENGTSLGTFTLRLVSLPGDFDGDNLLGSGDVDELCNHWGQASARIDLTGDGLVNSQDLLFWVEELRQTRLGDSNLDGTVNFSDFLALSDRFGQPSTWATGDFDCSGDTTFDDFLQLSGNFGFPASSNQQNASAVPEPGGWWCLLPAIACWSLLRRTRRQAAVGGSSSLSPLCRAKP